MSFLVMKCCHLYEIKAHKALRTVAARNAKLTAWDLLYSNDFCNLITTCEMCHVDFDAYKIGGFALDHNRCRDWRFAILNILQESSWSHGRPIQYNRPLAVLEDRMVHIVSKNWCEDLTNSTHYCHFCTATFTGVAGFEEAENHIQTCRIAAAT